MGRTVKEHAQMMKYLTRPRDVFPDPSSMDQASLAEELEPGSLKDEMLKDFDPSQETYEEYLQRKNLVRPFNMAEGGQMVKPSVDGSRPGYGGTRPADAEFKNKTIPKYAKELETWVKKNIKNYKNLKDIDKMYNDAVKHFSKEPYANQKFGKNFLSESTIKASRLKGGEKVFTFRLGDYAYGDIFKLGEQTSDATSKVRYVKDMMTIELINNNPKLKKIFTDYYNGKPINDNDMRIISRFNKEYLKGGTSKRPNLLRAWFQKLNPDFEKIRQDVAVFQDAISKQIATQRDNTNLSSPMRKKYKEAYTALRRMSSTFRTNFVKEFPKTVSKKAMDFHGNQIAKELFQWEHKAPRVTRDITNLPASYLARITQTPGTFNVFKMRYFDEPLDNLILKYELAKPNKRKGIEKEIKTLYKNFNTKSGGYLKPLKISFNETTGKINLKDTTPILKPTDYQTYKKQVAKNIIHADTYYKNIGEKKYRYDKNTIKSLLKELCPRGGSASGGRIGFNTAGAVLGSGANCGRNHMNKLLKNGTGTTEERYLIRQVMKAGFDFAKGTGKFAVNLLNPKEFLKLKNWVGGPAIAFMAGVETVDVADRWIRQGIPIKEALGEKWTKFLQPKSLQEYQVEGMEEANALSSPASKRHAKGIELSNDLVRAYDQLEMLEAGEASKLRKTGDVERIAELKKLIRTKEKKYYDYLYQTDEKGNVLGDGELDFIKDYNEYRATTKKGRDFGLFKTTGRDFTDLDIFGGMNDWGTDKMSGLKVKRDYFPMYEIGTSKIPSEQELAFDATLAKEPFVRERLVPLPQLKDFKYQNKELPAQDRINLENALTEKGVLPPRTSLSEIPLPGGNTYDLLKDLTDDYNSIQKSTEARMYPAYSGSQFSEGGITTLRSKYEYKK